MFKSFFPNPRLFFSSAAAWAVVCVALWYASASDWGGVFGLRPVPAEQVPVGLGYFATGQSIWFYIYFLATMAIFCLFWQLFAKQHRWVAWSTWGSAFILWSLYFSVDISVAINTWRGPFYNMLVKAFEKPGNVTEGEILSGVIQFLQLACVYVVVIVIVSFVTSHYLFRWRTAMNDYYLTFWPKIRHIEGASQRVQEDTMRFATTVEGLGQRLIDAVMTLIAFMPLLVALSHNVTRLPIVGAIPYPLVFAALGWSVLGTLLLVFAGIKLPGLQFENQRVEAAFRKELVYGEDDPERAQPPTLRELYDNVRKNYFRMYFHYVYFNIVRYLYLQIDNIFAILILLPTISAAAITFGAYQQIREAFGQVTSSFQYLVTSWSTIVELLSIYKRLRAFEAQIEDKPLDSIEQEPVNA